MDVSESTKRSPPPSPGDEGGYKGKVCVIFDCAYELTLFILDFDADAAASTEFIEAPPILRFDEDLGMLHFCLIDTQLYVIGADSGDTKTYYTKLWMSEYDLRPHMVSDSDSPPPPPNLLLDSAALKSCRVPPMNADKCYPIVVPTPDGRILVYSKGIPFPPRGDGTEYSDFEVYDPKQKQWQTLPQLDVSHLFYVPNRSGLFETAAASFINGTSIFLLTLKIGLMYTLDLSSLEKGWQAYRNLDLDDVISDGVVATEFLVVEPILVTPHWVKDMRMSIDSPPVPLPNVLPPGTSYGTLKYPDVRMLVLKYVRGRECFTCTVTSGFLECHEFPFLICSTYQHDVAPGGGGELIPLGTFKYLIPIELPGMIMETAFVMAFEPSLQTKRLKTG